MQCSTFQGSSQDMSFFESIMLQGQRAVAVRLDHESPAGDFVHAMSTSQDDA